MNTPEFEPCESTTDTIAYGEQLEAQDERLDCEDTDEQSA